MTRTDRSSSCSRRQFASGILSPDAFCRRRRSCLYTPSNRKIFRNLKCSFISHRIFARLVLRSDGQTHRPIPVTGLVLLAEPNPGFSLAARPELFELINKLAYLLFALMYGNLRSTSR